MVQVQDPGGKNPIEDRLNGFHEGLQTDSEETPCLTRTVALHDLSFLINKM
jgi:hypothetical protein